MSSDRASGDDEASLLIASSYWLLRRDRFAQDGVEIEAVKAIY
jgi:hypothetical protein